MKEKLKTFFSNKTVRIVCILVAALALILIAWSVFGRGEKTSGKYTQTEREERLSLLLSEISGAGTVRVMISEEEGTPIGAVVVFDGDDAILTRLQLTQVAANVLNIAENCVLVYPSAR